MKVNGEFRQLNTNLLQSENEYYRYIRPKRVARSGEHPSQALKRGGWFGVVDHAAPDGTGAEHAKDRDKGAHRIDEEYVKKIFADAGFVLEANNDVLRNQADDRSKPFYDESFRGKTTDRFVLRFRKKAQ